MTDEDITTLDGVGEATAEKLRDAGYDTFMGIATLSAAELHDVADLGEKTAQKIIQSAREKLDIGFQTGAKKWEERQKMGRITTGVASLNELFGGGVETQAITEVYGEFGSGKTQFALQLAANSQLPPEEGGLGKGVIYLDTEDTFIPERFRQLAEAKGLDPDAALENMFVGRAFNSDHQMLLADKSADLLQKNDIGLLVVDSLTAHFRSDYMGRGKLAERQQKLNKHLSTLQRLSSAHNIAVIVTNQVMSRPDIMFGDPTAPIGGHILGHRSAFRVYLRKGKKGKRIARLVDSPYLPEAEAVFNVTNNGLEDAD